SGHIYADAERFDVVPTPPGVAQGASLLVADEIGHERGIDARVAAAVVVARALEVQHGGVALAVELERLFKVGSLAVDLPQPLVDGASDTEGLGVRTRPEAARALRDEAAGIGEPGIEGQQWVLVGAQHELLKQLLAERGFRDVVRVSLRPTQHLSGVAEGALRLQPLDESQVVIERRRLRQVQQVAGGLAVRVTEVEPDFGMLDTAALQHEAEPDTEVAPCGILRVAGADREPEATGSIVDDPVRVRVDGGQRVDEARDTVETSRVGARRPWIPVHEIG